MKRIFRMADCGEKSLRMLDGLKKRGRNSDNRLIQEKLKWKPGNPLEASLKVTYTWIQRQLKES